jgi:hypothetical protein
LTVASMRVRSGGSLERTLAALLITGSALFELCHYQGVMSSLYCIIVGLIATLGGYICERRGFFLTGTICLGAGLFYQVVQAIHLYSMSPWISLAVLGVAIVIGSSYAERYFGVMVARVKGFANDIKQWE